MKNKAILVALAPLFVLMAAPVKADIVTDQSRIWVPRPQWVGLETVARPIRGTSTLQ